MHTGTYRFRLTIWGVVWAMLMLGGSMGLQAQEGDRIAARFLNNVAQLTVTFSDGGAERGTEHGFGFVVGERDDRLYLATANHVVRADAPDVSTDRVLVRFYADRGMAYPARLLDLAHRNLDLALLELAKPFPTYVWTACCTYPTPARGDRVWFIGRNQEWFVPTDNVAGVIRAAPLMGELPVSISEVQPGTSGAPLLAAQGIVGMIIEDVGGDAIALDIETIRQVVQERWGYPWGLETFAALPQTPAPAPGTSLKMPIPTPPARSSASQMPGLSVTAYDHHFALNACVATETAIICDVTIVAGRDEALIFDANMPESQSILFDACGREYPAVWIQAGNDAQQPGQILIDGLIGIPIHVRLAFESVNLSEPLLPLVLLAGYSSDLGAFLKIPFRDVPIEAALSPVACQTSIQTVSDAARRYDLRQCARQADAVVCDIAITPQRDEVLAIDAIMTEQQSRLFDAAGVEYQAAWVRIGRSQHSDQVSEQFFANLPRIVSLGFELFPLQEERISGLLVTGYHAMSGQFMRVTFRDIPILPE